MEESRYAFLCVILYVTGYILTETLPISPYELANDRSAHLRASGWKLQHFSSQMQEQVRLYSKQPIPYTHSTCWEINWSFKSFMCLDQNECVVVVVV